MPNGEKVEIKLQMSGNNPGVVKTDNSTTTQKPKPQKPAGDPKESIESLQATILAIKKINEAAVMTQQGNFPLGATKTKKKYTVKKTSSASLPTAFQDFLELSQMSGESLEKTKKPSSSLIDDLSGPNKKRRPGGADGKKTEEKSEEESSEESDEYEDDDTQDDDRTPYYTFGRRQLPDKEKGKEEKDGRIVIRIGRNRYVNRMKGNLYEMDAERQKSRMDHRNRVLEQMIAKNNPRYRIYSSSSTYA